MNTHIFKVNNLIKTPLFIILLMLSLSFTITQTNPKGKTAPQKTTYTINDKPVDKAVFDKLYHSLIEVKGTWHCGETTHGGVTGFQGKTKNGTLYEYEMISEKNHNAASIKKIK